MLMDKTIRIVGKSSPADDLSQVYVGRWNHLISTTNWEKGQIISQWQADLESKVVIGSKFSDEAWSRRVGNISPQHVGRLRRVYARYGRVWQDYQGLYWSHFLGAVDWQDAELWLEGAVQNGWSVSQMRLARWEALGAPDDQKPGEGAIIMTELDEDLMLDMGEQQTAPSRTTTVRDLAGPKPAFGPDLGDEGKVTGVKSELVIDRREETPRIRPFEELATLPADVSESFDSFKLAILRHKGEGWREVTRDDLISTLEALKELALAP
jgi:hypothetical protein